MTNLYFTFHFVDGSEETVYMLGYSDSLKIAQQTAAKRGTKIAGYTIGRINEGGEE